MSGHVFISHGSEDSQDADALADFIESRGMRAWIAPRDVRPGQDYSEQLQEALESCAAFVVLVTDKANKSPYVRAETEMAFSNGKPIFPVRNSDIQPGPGLAFFLKIRHWTDAFGIAWEITQDGHHIELSGRAPDGSDIIATGSRHGRSIRAQWASPFGQGAITADIREGGRRVVGTASGPRGPFPFDLSR